MIHRGLASDTATGPDEIPAPTRPNHLTVSSSAATPHPPPANNSAAPRAALPENATDAAAGAEPLLTGRQCC
jgi:hypothetical protein